MAASITFSQRLAAITYAAANKEFANNVWDNVQTMQILLSKPGFKVVRKWPDIITLNHDLKDNGQTQMVAEYGTYSVGNVETGFASQHTLKLMTNTHIRFSLEEQDSASSPEAVIDLVDYKTKSAKSAMNDNVNAQIFSTSVGANDFNSLDTIVGTATFGGINVTTYPNFVSTVDSNSAVLTPSKMETMITSVSFGSSPDLICTTPLLYNKYVADARNAIRFMNPGEGNLSFERIHYKGATMYWDRDIATGYMYFLTSKDLQWMVQKGRDMEVMDTQWEDRSFVFHTPVVLRAQLAPIARRTQGKYTALTAV